MRAERFNGGPEDVPLFLIENDDVGLLGARIRAERLLRFEDGGSCRVLG